MRKNKSRHGPPSAKFGLVAQNNELKGSDEDGYSSDSLGIQVSTLFQPHVFFEVETLLISIF